MVRISIIGPAPEVEHDVTFKEVQDGIDHAQWVGRGWTGELPGGGNADNDGDTDPIETLHGTNRPGHYGEHG